MAADRRLLESCSILRDLVLKEKTSKSRNASQTVVNDTQRHKSNHQGTAVRMHQTHFCFGGFRNKSLEDGETTVGGLFSMAVKLLAKSYLQVRDFASHVDTVLGKQVSVFRAQGSACTQSGKDVLGFRA